MRKLFRMKYESCNGQCYADDDVVQIHTLGLDRDGTGAFLKRLLAMHGPSCGNPELAFRLDVDDVLGVYVASFYRYGSLDLFADKTALGAMNKLIDAAIDYYGSDEYKLFMARMPGAGHDVCHHGDDKKLVDFALRFSGLPVAEQRAVRSQFA